MRLRNISVRFEPRDLWVGVYWTPEDWVTHPHPRHVRGYSIYLCLVPMLPICFEVW